MVEVIMARQVAGWVGSIIRLQVYSCQRQVVGWVGSIIRLQVCSCLRQVGGYSVKCLHRHFVKKSSKCCKPTDFAVAEKVKNFKSLFLPSKSR